jgi:hypothetical protein
MFVRQISRLLENYRSFVSLPWQSNLAGSQRVWFAVYPPPEERRLRAHLEEFEIATREAKHNWRSYDITALPALWLSNHEFREEYFSAPHALTAIGDELDQFVGTEIRTACEAPDVDEQTVVSIVGTGSLFGFAHVSGIVSQVEDAIRGRLLVFFPGEYEGNFYRFMDARDGFNYRAVPITCSERILT